jgi:hypothetical protein
MQLRILATRRARGLHLRCPSPRQGGSRECRVLAAPAVSCAMFAKRCAHEHTGTAEAHRHSLRNGLTAYAALSLETNSSCLHRCRLDGQFDPVRSSSPPAAWHQPRVSGPHGFAVRIERRSSCTPFAAHEIHSPCGHPVRRLSRVHHIPPRVRDDRDTPLLSRRDSEKKPLIWGEREAINICRRDWTTQIRLNLFSKLDFTRTHSRKLQLHFSHVFARLADKLLLKRAVRARPEADARCPRRSDIFSEPAYLG